MSMIDEMAKSMATTKSDWKGKRKDALMAAVAMRDRLNYEIDEATREIMMDGVAYPGEGEYAVPAIDWQTLRETD